MHLFILAARIFLEQVLLGSVSCRKRGHDKVLRKYKSKGHVNNHVPSLKSKGMICVHVTPCIQSNHVLDCLGDTYLTGETGTSEF